VQSLACRDVKAADKAIKELKEELPQANGKYSYLQIKGAFSLSYIWYTIYLLIKC